MRAILLSAGLALAAPPPATPHCYSTWHYPWAQHCGAAQAKHKVWFVEITAPPPPAKEELTQDQKDQREHDKAVRDYKDILNEQLEDIRAHEDGARILNDLLRRSQ